MADIGLHVAGNITDDPELRFTPSGAAVASFTVASTPRYFDVKTQEWKDGEPTFVRCTVWREQAENIAESLRRGNRVVVTGTLRQHNWEDNDGNKRSRLEMQCDEVAASMRFATVRVTRRGRSVEDNYEPPVEDRYPDPVDDDAPEDDGPEDAAPQDAPAQALRGARAASAARGANGDKAARPRATERRERATTRR